MTSTINQLLFPFFWFIVCFSIASLVLYTPTEITTNQNISTSYQLSAAFQSKAIQFDNFYTQVKELMLDEITESEPPLAQFTVQDPSETQPQLPLEETTKPEYLEPQITYGESIPTKTVQNLYIQSEIEEIINNLTKRQSLKLFTPLKIKRKVGKLDKNLTTTKSEIQALYRENPLFVSTAIKTNLPELFS